MSLNREAAYWKAPDGTWSLGFWWFEFTGDPADDDCDTEWDVEYSDGRFWFLTTGHNTLSAAMKAYRKDHPNPEFALFDDGSPTTLDDHDRAEIARWQEVAEAFRAKYGTAVEAYDHP